MDGGATEIEEVESVEDLGHLEKWWNVPGIVIWSLILFGSFLLNATLLLAFLKRPGLRTISNRFVMNLSISNLLTVALINCLLIFDNEQSSYVHCSLSEGATALITTSSILSVLLIALDQYLAVVDPLRYRTRINKLKCGILIFSIWIISIIFSLLSAFNPNPKSLWLACNKLSTNNSSLININNNNGNINYEILIKLKENNSIDELFNNTILNADININNNLFIITYGFIYAMTTGLIIYLLPFISVCWIYINIYLAAHKNSQRTRRNGSRPILSSFNYNDDYYSPIRNDIVSSGDEIRRIPKISSLSSIDESIETATSQLPIQCSNKINNNDINNDTVIFTVGEQKVDVKNNSDNIKNTKDIKVPIAVLKRKFLSKKYQQTLNKYQNNNIINNNIKSHFNDDDVKKRKSSHDLMYDEMMMENNYLELNKRDNNYLNNFSDSDDDDDDDNITINNVNDDIKYPQLMTNNNFKVMDDELIMNEFKNKVQNSLSNKENSLLLLRNDGNNGNNNNHNYQFNDSNIIKISSDNLINSNNGLNSTPIVTITPPNKISLQRVSSTRSTASYINCLKYRISNASLFKYREETRAARISALVIVMGFICWTPYFILTIVKYIKISNDNLSHNFNIAAMSLLIFATYISPLLFGYRSRRVKRELRKFFCFQKELSYKNNRSLMAKKVLKRRHSGNLSHLDMDNKYNIFNCVYGRNKWPKEKVQFVQVPDTALAVETCRSSFSSGASTQISSTSTDEN